MNVESRWELSEKHKLKEAAIDAFAQSWVYTHVDAIASFPGAHDIMVLFVERDREELVEMTAGEIYILSQALGYYRGELMNKMAGSSVVPAGFSAPAPHFAPLHNQLPVIPAMHGEYPLQPVARLLVEEQMAPRHNGNMMAQQSNRRDSMQSMASRPIVDQQSANYRPTGPLPGE